MEKGQLVASGSLAEISLLATQGRNLRIKSISPLEEVKSKLNNLVGVGQVQDSGDGDRKSLEVEFQGDDDAVANLLSALVSQGVKVISFVEITNNLEEIFLSLTNGEVA